MSDVPGKPKCIRGSMIHFAQESIVAQPRPKFLPRTNAEEYLLLHLLGDGSKVDIIKKTLGGDMRSPVRVDASFNMSLLLGMQAVNPVYKVDDVSIHNHEEGVRIQEQTQESILRRAVIDSDPRTEETSNITSSSATIPNGQEYISGFDETIMYKRTIGEQSDDNPRTKFLMAAHRLFSGSDNKSSSNGDSPETGLCDSSELDSQQHQVRALGSTTFLSRSSKPLNEFDSADLQTLFAGRFSDLFFLGQAFKGCKGTPSKNKIDHLLHFYDNRFCSNEFLFFLGDMLERHEIARNSKGKLMNSATTVKMIEDKVLDQSIVQRIEIAMQNPETSDARALYKMLETVVKVISGTIEFSPAARASLLQVMHSQIFHYNLPSWFNTYSPDDSYDILTVRRALVDRRVTNDSNDFEDNEHAEILKCLRKGGEGRIHCTNLVAGNGVAAALIFERRKQARAKHLLKVDLTARKTTIVEDKLKGIFGVVFNIQSVLEVQARQALHEHYLLWTSLFPPSFLELCANHPMLVKAIAGVLDSMVKAKLSISAIEDRIVRRVESERIEINDQSIEVDGKNSFIDADGIKYGLKWPEMQYTFLPRAKLQRPCLLFGPGPMKDDPTLPHLDAFEAYEYHCHQAQGYVGYHDEHSCTCKKGANGEKSCRMGYEVLSNDWGTTCFEIEVDQTTKIVNEKVVTITDVMVIPPNEHDIPPLRRIKFQDIGKSPVKPFPKADGRMLIWSLDRPSKFPNSSVILFDDNPNGHVVPFNDLLTYLDGCNTAIYPLGSTEAAKVKVYYMTKYLIKDQGAFKKLLSIATTAYNLTIDHPNIYVEAKQSGTVLDNNVQNNSINETDENSNIEVNIAEQERQAQLGDGRSSLTIDDSRDSGAGSPTSSSTSQTEYNSVKRFGNTLLNTMRSTYERSSQETASKLLGYSASYSSIRTWFIFMKSAKEQVSLASQTSKLEDISNIWKPHEDIFNNIFDEDDVTIDDAIDVENDDTLDDCIYSDDEDEKLNDIHGDDKNKTEYVEIIHNSGCIGLKTTNQYEAYRYRSI